MTMHNAISQMRAKALGSGKHADGQGLWLFKSRQEAGKLILRLVVSGKRREMGLGRWPDVSIGEARRRAEDARRQLRDGLDPIEERAKQKVKVKRLTLAEAVEGCFEARQAELKDDGKAGRWMSPLSVHVIPKIGTTPVEEIDQHVLKRVFEPISDEYINRLGTSPVSSWGYALWDRSLEQVLFVQSACEPDKSGSPCTRKALWLTADLEPLHIVELPGETLVKIKSGYSCFSCGCGCYSHQALHVEGGNIFAHVWGYPVANERRGIYRLKQASSGPYWEKVVSGRPQPPLAFSPSGAKVAYFELSPWGDRFVVADVPDDT